MLCCVLQNGLGKHPERFCQKLITLISNTLLTSINLYIWDVVVVVQVNQMVAKAMEVAVPVVVTG